MRHVVLPQAIRRVAPPLLNDFISLQKDVALVSILGPLEAFRVAQIEAVLELHLHAAGRRGAALPLRHGPAGARCSTAGSASAGDDRRSSRSAASRRPTATARCCAGSTSRSPSTARSR